MLNAKVLEREAFGSTILRLGSPIIAADHRFGCTVTAPTGAKHMPSISGASTRCRVACAAASAVKAAAAAASAGCRATPGCLAATAASSCRAAIAAAKSLARGA